MFDLQVLPSAPSQIRQHNVLTTARYNYTELQMDIMIFLISKLRQTKDNLVYTLPLQELSRLTGKEYNYSYLKDSTADMGSRVFEVKTDNTYDQIWMFQKISYLDGKGVIQVTLSNDILPYLFDLKNNFTSYEIEASLKLSSKYAKRIYQICSQWKDRGATPTYDLLDLKKMLGLIDAKGNEEYPAFGNFKTRVLNPAIEQINSRTDLSVKLIVEKNGRAYSAVGFLVKKTSYALSIQFPNTNLPLPAPKGIGHDQFDNAERILDEVGINDPKLRNQILTSADMVKLVLKFSYEVRTGKIKATTNAGGLLLVRLGLRAPAKSKGVK